jgi:apolipoprotein N-acyltransferase
MRERALSAPYHGEMGMTPFARFAAKTFATFVSFVVLVMVGLAAEGENQSESFPVTFFTVLGLAGVVLMWFAYFFATGGDNRRVAGTFLLGAAIAFELWLVVGFKG